MQVEYLKIREIFLLIRKSTKDREKVAKGLKKRRISKWKEFKMHVAVVSTNVSKVKPMVNSFLDSVLIQGTADENAAGICRISKRSDQPKIEI